MTDVNQDEVPEHDMMRLMQPMAQIIHAALEIAEQITGRRMVGVLVISPEGDPGKVELLAPMIDQEMADSWAAKIREMPAGQKGVGNGTIN